MRKRQRKKNDRKNSRSLFHRLKASMEEALDSLKREVPMRTVTYTRGGDGEYTRTTIN